jgi:hypothetical protein
VGRSHSSERDGGKERKKTKKQREREGERQRESGKELEREHEGSTERLSTLTIFSVSASCSLGLQFFFAKAIYILRRSWSTRFSVWNCCRRSAPTAARSSSSMWLLGCDWWCDSTTNFASRSSSCGSTVSFTTQRQSNLQHNPAVSTSSHACSTRPRSLSRCSSTVSDPTTRASSARQGLVSVAQMAARGCLFLLGRSLATHPKRNNV